MTAKKKAPAKKPAGGKAAAATSQRDTATSGQPSTEATGPTTTAGELEVGDVIYAPVPGMTAGVLVEAIAHVSIGGRDRVRARFYGQASGLRTTMMLNADEPVRTAPAL